ncbi:hypothetical protein BDQ17DRAFT_1308413 [Cyathus striatus]|nr:hypothetical protein BDQ17DRAFT_1308413 [Cyathus striatus]
MPIITSPSKVLVSGANGYVAIWVVRTLLERGHSVRGTVRSASKGKYLEEYFKSYGDKFELVVVEDITTPGAFDEAVKGVDFIEHTASPFHLDVDDPEELYRPAIRGTVGILESALKNGPSIKRIVVTSSCASVMSPPSVPTKFSEKDWNETSPRVVAEQGRAAAPITKYLASKTLAEKSAWEFYNKHKSEVSWDLAVINPPFIFGPAIHEIPNLKALNTSLKAWYEIVVKNVPGTKASLEASNAWIDVRDVAEAHVRALEKETAGGERIIVSAGEYVWQEWLDAANALSPQPYTLKKLPDGYSDIKKVYFIQYATTKQQQLLGIKLKTVEETTRDSLVYFEEKGGRLHL